MKASKVSDRQNAFILKQSADGVPVADRSRNAGISAAVVGRLTRKALQR